MKKLKTYSILAVLSLLMIPSITKVNATELLFDGTLTGGCTLTYQKTETDLYCDFLVKPNVSKVFSGDGIAIRMKNNNTTGNGTNILIYINETDSDRAELTNGSAIEFYDLNGTKTNATVDNNHDIILPINFDGYVYLPYASFHLKDGYGSGNKSLTYAEVWGVYFELSCLYHSGANYTIGSIEVLNGTTATKVADPSILTDLNYNGYYLADYNGTYLNIDHDSTGTGGVVLDVDYTKLSYPGSIDGGCTVSFLGTSTDVSANYCIYLQESVRHIGTDCDSIAIRIRNHTSISTPVTFMAQKSITEKYLIEKANGDVFYLNDKNELSLNVWRAWDSALVIPPSFDGYVIIPVKVFNNAPSDLTIRNFSLFTSIKNGYDAFTNITYSDIIKIAKNGAVSMLQDASTLTSNTKFNQTYTKVAYADNIFFEVYKEAETLAKRVGDVKFLETFDHVTTDSTMNKEFPVWNAGGELTLTLDKSTGRNCMKIEVGGTAAGVDNTYGSINIFPKSYTSDWNKWADGGENKNQKAQGLTFYLKSLSDKEGIINMEFDEIVKNYKGVNVTERWNVQLGAMIMFYDINTNEEFIRFAKPAIPVPVGFEGYVRIPFTEYQVPTWSTDGDGSLDLTGNMAGIYFTSNCADFEGLTILIGDIGIYYNKTVISTGFVESPISIKNNMKGE